MVVEQVPIQHSYTKEVLVHLCNIQYSILNYELALGESLEVSICLFIYANKITGPDKPHCFSISWIIWKLQTLQWFD